MGGRAAWSKVESIRLNGVFEQHGQNVPFVMVKKRPDQVRVTLSFDMPEEYSEGFQVIFASDGNSVWSATRLTGGEVLKSQKAEDTVTLGLVEEAEILPKLLAIRERGATLSYTGTISKDESPLYVIKASFPDKAYTDTYYISTDTHRLVEYTREDQYGVLTKTKILSYERQNSVLIPSNVIVENSEAGATHTRVSSIEIGVGIYDDYFSLESLASGYLGSKNQ